MMYRLMGEMGSEEALGFCLGILGCVQYKKDRGLSVSFAHMTHSANQKNFSNDINKPGPIRISDKSDTLLFQKIDFDILKLILH